MATSSVNQGLSATEQAQLAAAFPAVAAADLEAVVRVLPTNKLVQAAYGVSYPAATLISADAIAVLLNGLPVRIPGRIYFAEPSADAEEALTVRQQGVLNCLYLRHHDGYLRQRRLEQLLAAPVELFSVPFTFSLIGEYVVEILEVLAQALQPGLLASYVDFIRENPTYWQLIQARVISYWDVYYRRYGFPHYQHYVGAQLLGTLRQACQQATLS